MENLLAFKINGTGWLCYMVDRCRFLAISKDQIFSCEIPGIKFMQYKCCFILPVFIQKLEMAIPTNDWESCIILFHIFPFYSFNTPNMHVICVGNFQNSRVPSFRELLLPVSLPLEIIIFSELSSNSYTFFFLFHLFVMSLYILV